MKGFDVPYFCVNVVFSGWCRADLRVDRLDNFLIPSHVTGGCGYPLVLLGTILCAFLLSLCTVSRLGPFFFI